ncbi:Flagellar biosynthesis protein FliS [hydrothermal vent metagenome]|uniref:Flagellar biosynthesis protein FliS n=1 Tax=hydrothermal vent metagenome TaxID=652676 RepID=A0A1W1BCA5_9ZZZZ
MSTNLAYSIYAQNNIGVESPAKLVEMMYEGILRFNAQAKKAIEKEDVEKRAYWINRSIAVISELLATINYDAGNVSMYLSGLYTYQIKLLTEANVENDKSKIDTVNNVFRGLLEAWRETNGLA